MTVYDAILAELTAIRVLLEQRLPEPVAVDEDCRHTAWNGSDGHCPRCYKRMGVVPIEHKGKVT